MREGPIRTNIASSKQTRSSNLDHNSFYVVYNVQGFSKLLPVIIGLIDYAYTILASIERGISGIGG